MKKRLFLVICLITLIVGSAISCGNCVPEPGKRYAPKDDYSTAHKLAILYLDDTAVKANHPIVRLIQKLIEQTKNNTGLSEKRIGDMAYKSYELLQKQKCNGDTSLPSILGAMSTGLDRKFGDFNSQQAVLMVFICSGN